MKRILLFGAGKAATTLIQYLSRYCEKEHCELVVCDQNIELAQSKIRGFRSSYAITFDVKDAEARRSAISKADIVISLLPPSLHILVAHDCILFYKDLLTASYIDPQLYELENEIKNRNILFLSEMGLDPGIDHMSAMSIIHQIQEDGGKIEAFHSYCGGLVAPESDDNPWRYKITWNPMNVVEAGIAGARYLKNGEVKEVPYRDVFSFENQLITVDGLDEMAWYANRDSLSYKALYQLDDIQTFVRATLRYPRFNKVWNLFVNMELSDLHDGALIKDCTTKSEWFNKKLALFKKQSPEHPVLKILEEAATVEQLGYFGLFDDEKLPSDKSSSANILLSILVDKLKMKDTDKDMIVMVHEIDFTLGDQRKRTTSTLIVKGEDILNTAMSKTVGLPLAIATTLILEGKIKIKGLHIPIVPEIYQPVLKKLEDEGIIFKEETETREG